MRVANMFKEMQEICRTELYEIKNAVFKNKYPRELQFPITYKCNFDCVMCGMRKLTGKGHCSPDEIREILRDQLFCEVASVGVNGGEPFLRTDLYDCIEAIAETLPNLKNIYMISNGYLTEQIVNTLLRIKALLTEKKIGLTVSFSVDGIEDLQDLMRGKKGAFLHVEHTLDVLQEDLAKYCDHLNIICTITKKNVYDLYQVDKWAKQRGLTVSYNIATVNARIDNFDKYEDFSVFTEPQAKMMATEFFYQKYKETYDPKYYALFLFCHEQYRYYGCAYQYHDGVTLTPDGMVCYCATHSEIIGDARKNSALRVFQEHQEYQKQLRSKYCAHCSHYIYGLNSRGLIRLFTENNRYRWLNLYRRIKKKLWSFV